MGVPVRMFMVMCAVRRALSHDDDAGSSHLALEVTHLAHQLDHMERNQIIADIESRIANPHYRQPPVADEWVSALDTLENTQPEGASSRVTVSENLIGFAVRYALGRLTYMPGMVAEEIVSVADLLSDRTRAEIATAIVEHSAGSRSDDLSAPAWRVTVDALTAVPLAA